MKKIQPFSYIVLLVAALLFTGISKSSAQLEQGNLLVGGDIASFNLGINKGAPFIMKIDPKVATFIVDNIALGGYLNLDLQSQKGSSFSTYGIGALGRYYVNSSKLPVLKHSKFFVEGTIGFQGTHSAISGSPGSNTNGLGFGVGPGFSYFITPNVALETLVKYLGNVGFGNNPYAQKVELSIGFQIFLPNSRVRRVLNDVKGR